MVIIYLLSQKSENYQIDLSEINRSEYDKLLKYLLNNYMTYNEKRSLYESIMKEVAKTVKKALNETVKDVVDVENLKPGVYLTFSFDGKKPRTYFKFEKYGLDNYDRKCIEGISVDFISGSPKSKFDINNKAFDICWEATNWPVHIKRRQPPYSEFLSCYTDLFALKCQANRGEIRYATPEEIEFIKRIISKQEYKESLEKNIPDELIDELYKEISNSEQYLECNDEKTFRRICKPYIYKVIKEKTGYSKGSEVAEMIYVKLGIEEEFDPD